MERYTISCHHGGGKANRGHNIREAHAIKNQEHIDTTKPIEIWKDMTEAQAYKLLFGEAQEKYNEKQKRKDRKIRSYHANVERDAKLHTSYECIVQIGTTDNHPPVEECKKVLKEYLEYFEKKNPNMFVYGAYLHLDEATPHLHIDYIPIAHGYKKGLEIQTSLTKALKEMGYEGCATMTAQTKWQNDERKEFEKICNRHNFFIEHPIADGMEEQRMHMETSQYKATKQLEETLQCVEDNKEAASQIQSKIEEKSNQLEKIEENISHKQNELDSITGTVKEAKDLRKERKKHFFSKDEITIPYEEYQSLYKTATSIESVKKAQESLNQRESQLNYKESQIKPKMDELDAKFTALEEKSKMQDVYIKREAKRMVEEIMDNTPTTYTQRLESFVSRFKLDEMNMLDKFRQEERNLKQKLIRGRDDGLGR